MTDHQSSLGIDTETKRINKELPIPLTEQEFSERGKELAEAHKEYGSLEREFKAVKKDWAAKLGSKEEHVSQLAGVIRDGFERRIVECEVVLDFTSNEVRYVYQGNVIETRAMTAEERQQGFAFDASVIRRTPDEVLAAEPEPIDASYTVVQDPQEEIRDIIRDETRQLTKSSAVDGAVTH